MDRESTLRNSFRARLIVGAVLWISAGLLLSGLVLSQLFEELVIRQVDHDLLDHAEELRMSVERRTNGSIEVVRGLSDARFAVPQSGLYWQIDSPTGQTLRSPSLEHSRLPLETIGTDGLQKMATEIGPVRINLQLVQIPGLVAPLRLAVGMAQSSVDAELAHFDRALAASLAVIALGLSGAAVLQVTVGLWPLARVRRSLMEVRAARAERLPDDLPREVAPLVDDLNSMIASNTEMLRRARTQAGTLAHALKTPLAILLDEARQLEAGGEARAARLIEEQCLKMQRQIDFEMARARAAGRGTPGVAAAVHPTVSSVVAALSRLNRERCITFHFEAPDDLTVACDPQDFSEIVGNLADNAAKWARSRVSLSASRTGGVILLCVEDDGPGIPPVSRETVFGLGARLDETMRGSGLGLAIARELVTHYGGRIWLDASRLGGTRASVELPAIAA
ncbi:sensor histidine kinase [Reyranella sp.]|uniref:sensor histidine kinase n=1 Tax=Reyranella sp. TaxID=1929291 RepID=UPI003D0B1DF7